MSLCSCSAVSWIQPPQQTTNLPRHQVSSARGCFCFLQKGVSSDHHLPLMVCLLPSTAPLLGGNSVLYQSTSPPGRRLLTAAPGRGTTHTLQPKTWTAASSIWVETSVVPGVDAPTDVPNTIVAQFQAIPHLEQSLWPTLCSCCAICYLLAVLQASSYIATL